MMEGGHTCPDDWDEVCLQGPGWGCSLHGSPYTGALA